MSIPNKQSYCLQVIFSIDLHRVDDMDCEAIIYELSSNMYEVCDRCSISDLIERKLTLHKENRRWYSRRDSCSDEWRSKCLGKCCLWQRSLIEPIMATYYLLDQRWKTLSFLWLWSSAAVHGVIFSRLLTFLLAW